MSNVIEVEHQKIIQSLEVKNVDITTSEKESNDETIKCKMVLYMG